MRAVHLLVARLLLGIEGHLEAFYYLLGVHVPHGVLDLGVVVVAPRDDERHFHGVQFIGVDLQRIVLLPVSQLPRRLRPEAPCA